MSCSVPTRSTCSGNPDRAGVNIIVVGLDIATRSTHPRAPRASGVWREALPNEVDLWPDSQPRIRGAA